MPAPVLSQSSTRPVAKVATHKPRASDTPKKRRVVRRRGRARGEPDSDDEIEREAATDSDSDDDDLSSLDSATDDSDTEPASEDVIPPDRAHLPTPRNSKSPETVVKDEVTNVNGGVPSFFAPAGDWSEMVADEKVNGPADLPVIEFADFSGHPVAQNGPPRKPKKASKPKRLSESRATPADSAHEAPPPVVESAPDRPEPHHNRVSSQSARQAYQHKLETDPSFVPTIGNFWGHDDRLIDTELRSLSGWWRGRGRGRGRGFGMRGRGGFQGPESRGGQGGEEVTSPKEHDLPPIERAWTHDGFEELRRKEEQRRAEHLAARNSQSSPKRGGFVAGRGGFTAGRGRGGFSRGGFASPTTHNASFSGRIRFAMKPELMWTKQHEAFLYFDSTLKPRPGQGPAFRIKVPGHDSTLVRAPPVRHAPSQASTSKAGNDGSEAGDKYFVVRLPKRAGKEREVVEKAEETPIEEVFTVRPQLASVVKPLPASEKASAPTVVTAPTQPTVDVHVKVVPEPNIRSQLEQLSLEPQASDPARQAKTEEAVLRNPPAEIAPDTQVSTEPSIVDRPALPPLQTTFSPPPPPPSQPISQRSPAYGSPYGYHPQLPMGVALNQHGIPFEVATGHPVYLQPPPMYNPRPLIPSHFSPGIFVPGHMHHSSAVSPDFLAQPPSHTPPMNGFIDPATGTPIFSFPRQTTRIEIRAPTEESGKLKSAPRTSSSLRTTAAAFQPSRATTASENELYQQPTSADAAGPAYEHVNGHVSMEDASQAGIPGMMPYPAYQQPYYYPEHYGYPQYVDMSQAGQYDMYSMDQAPQGTVYY
ncbi:hypothetical protein GALMADRAFT_236622 [Galerina marginata CBS 339.88]|uniref:Btz domain-containing protein n=1 Tax=Galerina marginata (strain CBS 339.88) TaxID=685588 RepID=A0A067TLE4_GALM3|nr:hypothetical protein GALMADRAFT_236622 [Galerina marginata CBS 339.88]